MKKILPKMLLNLFLALLSIVLIIVLGILGTIYTHLKAVIWVYRFGFVKTFQKLNGYYKWYGISIDQTGNVICQDWFNDWMLKDSKVYKYGSPDQTVSHVTGVNWKRDNLRLIGRLIGRFLDFVDKDHLENSSISEQYNNN
jgi:hypothetical protein